MSVRSNWSRNGSSENGDQHRRVVHYRTIHDLLEGRIGVGFGPGQPGIFWHIWGFISAGLYPHERRYVYFFLPASVILFVGGASLAFFGVFHYVLHFLLGFNASLGIDAAPRLNDYMSFALLLPLGFGVAFQLPLVMLIS